VVPILPPDHALAARPRRVLVAGTSGSGKTTLAARVSVVLGVPHVEIDALFHGPGWTPLETFEAEVARFSCGPAWVTEWQYDAVRDLLAARADLLVWLDLPRRTVMRQVVSRTVRRRLRRERLWNDNLEQPLWTVLTDRDHIVRWAWSTHDRSAVRVAELLRVRPDLPVVRVRTRDEASRWVEGPLRTAARGGDPSSEPPAQPGP
jgi:adenylate kinase family enzyme